MNAFSNVNMTAGTPTQKVDDAVGVSENCWFVAIVGNKSERQCAKKLEKLGYECYVATQEEIHQWRNGAKKIVERIIFPAMIFIHTSEQERKQNIVNLPYIKRFLPNRASATDSFGRHSVATIPDYQIQRLKYILGNADAPVEFDAVSFKLGDRVRVIRGGLIGAEGNILECAEKDSAYFAIQVDFLGVAKVRIKKDDMELIK